MLWAAVFVVALLVPLGCAVPVGGVPGAVPAEGEPGWSCLLQRDKTFQMSHEHVDEGSLHHSTKQNDANPQKGSLPYSSKQDSHSLLFAKESHGLDENNHPAVQPGQPAQEVHGVAQPGAHGAAAGAHGAAAGAHVASEESITALRVELHMPTTIKDVQSSQQGPVSRFLLLINREFCKAANMRPARLSLLGIRGEYTNVVTLMQDEAVVESLEISYRSHGNSDPLTHMQEASLGGREAHDPVSHDAPLESDPAQPEAQADATETATEGGHEALGQDDHEVIVDFELLPGSTVADPNPKQLFAALTMALQDSGSTLMTGDLGTILHGASLLVGARPTKDDVADQTAHGDGARSQNSMLIVVAAFVCQMVCRF